MKQTAVEFLLENIEILIKQGQPFNPIFKYYFIEEAKEMEKEQIINARLTLRISGVSYKEEAEQYYNETFKNK
tara:strand:+ start:572 stop:790 length:219 start_codon:yes stop_codon:yes gene_type:complete